MFKIKLRHGLAIVFLLEGVCLDHISIRYLFCDMSNLLNILVAVWHFQVKIGRLQTQLCNSGTTVIDLIFFFLVRGAFRCFFNKIAITYQTKNIFFLVYLFSMKKLNFKSYWRPWCIYLFKLIKLVYFILFCFIHLMLFFEIIRKMLLLMYSEVWRILHYGLS